MDFCVLFKQRDKAIPTPVYFFNLLEDLNVRGKLHLLHGEWRSYSPSVHDIQHVNYIKVLPFTVVQITSCK